ncbi:MAG TPA: hypothetical protein VF521_18080 [Pyrinomonadaceae bacterium]|jgi:hemerythrin-like domain-containing protein
MKSFNDVLGLHRGLDELFFRHQVSLLEHEKMRRLLAHFREQLPRLYELPEPSRALIKLLDQETTYKHLVEHHDEREGRHLYPALEQFTTEAEREDLLARLFELKPRG